MTPSRNLANLSSVFELFRVIGHVLFFRWRRLRERCQRKKKRRGKKKHVGTSGECEGGEDVAAHRRFIQSSVSVGLTRPSLWTLSAALLFLSSRITPSRTSDTAPDARDTRENCSGGVRKEEEEVRNLEKRPTLPPFPLLAPSFPSGRHFFQMSNRSPGTTHADLRGVGR